MINLEDTEQFVPADEHALELKLNKFNSEIKQIKEEAIKNGLLVYNKNDEFEYALAPNGEKSLLDEKQWLETRTSFFKNWFGDWQNDPKNSSIFIDENGEPMKLYHGTTRKFDKFSHEAPKTFNLSNVKGVFYFTSDKELAKMEYGQYKINLIIDVMREFNKKFFDGEETDWSKVIDKWNDFVRSIGTAKVDLRKKVPDGFGSFYDWTVTEYDGKTIFATEEIEKIWDSNLPEKFNESDYEWENWAGKQILLPKNSKPIVMELFINSRIPNKKQLSSSAISEMDHLFVEGLIEKGMPSSAYPGQEHIFQGARFNTKPKTDSIIVKLDGHFAAAVFHSNQIKSALGNNGFFNTESDSIYE